MMKKTIVMSMCAAALLSFPTLSMAQITRDNQTMQTGFVNEFGAGAGTATLTQTAKGLLVRVEATGLPEGWHGAAFHAQGDCTDNIDGFALAGLPLANAGEEHGFLNINGPKTGALPDIWVHGDGTGKAIFYTSAITLDALRDQDGSALMLYSGPDDYKTQPAGNTGTRIACAPIRMDQ